MAILSACSVAEDDILQEALVSAYNMRSFAMLGLLNSLNVSVKLAAVPVHRAVMYEMFAHL
jgi:hypothetical protein